MATVIPRAIVLLRYSSNASEGTLRGLCQSSILQEFPGEIGDNYTGGSSGGLSETYSGYVSAYCYKNDIYFSYTDKDTFASTITKVTETADASTPCIVPLGLSGGYILWNGTDNSQLNNTLYYATYSSDGTIGAVSSSTAPLSDCPPIHYNDNVLWYITKKSTPVFYSLEGQLSNPAYTLTVANGSGSGDYSEGGLVTITADSPAEGQKFFIWTSFDKEVNFADARNQTTTFTMPDHGLEVTANYTRAYSPAFSGSPGAVSTAPFPDLQWADNTFILPDNFFEKTGYTFIGWNDGTKTYQPGDVYTMPAEDVTFVAQWKSNDTGSGSGGNGGGSSSGGGSGNSGGSGGSGDGGSISPSLNTVSIEHPTNGTASVRPKSAAENDTVTITVTPDTGYELDTLTVVDANGKNVTATEKENNKYTFIMPETKVTVSVDFSKIAESEAAPAITFTDVAETAWYREAVQYMSERKLMSGVSATSFAPDATATRGMIVTILHQLEHTPDAASSSFSDVAAGKWYASAVTWAAENNIVSGYADGTFGPANIVTREQMATILYNYAKYKGYDVTRSADLAGFADAAQIHNYAKTAMQWVNAEGLINGINENTLSPTGSTTRAQLASILMNFCERVAK